VEVGGSQLEAKFVLNLRGDFELGLLNNVKAVKTMGILEDGLNGFCIVRCT
jgi:hypothetical protein